MMDTYISARRVLVVRDVLLRSLNDGEGVL